MDTHDVLDQGHPTCGLRKGFEWPAQCFLEPSVLSILAEVEDKFDVKALFSSIFIGPRKDFEWPAQCFFGALCHYDFDLGAKSSQSETDFR